MSDEHSSVVVVEKRPGIRLPDVRELWRYRGALLQLVWRETKPRYRQSALGVAWALIQPLGMMAVFCLSFGTWKHVGPTDLSYPLFAYLGILPWMYVSKAVAGASVSVVGNAPWLSRLYFPLLLVPGSVVIGHLADFLIGLAAVLLVLPWLGHPLSSNLFALVPALVLLSTMLALGLGLLFATFYVRFRDIGYALGFLFQLWMFCTPVAYSLEALPESSRRWMIWNPLVGIIEGFRSALLGKEWNWPASIASIGVTTVLGIVGTLWFQSRERTFLDVA